MRSITVFNSVTLDGVMQAPAHAQEDTRGGFGYGGWAAPYADQTTMEPASRGPAELLLGRRTFTDLESGWRNGPPDNPFTPIMNSARKYVVSRTLTSDPDWTNSVLLRGDATESVARLKSDGAADLTVLGSGELVRSLVTAGLVDRLVLLIHPLLIGSGIRLFDAGTPYSTFRLVESKASSTGVLIASYQRG